MAQTPDKTGCYQLMIAVSGRTPSSRPRAISRGRADDRGPAPRGKPGRV